MTVGHETREEADSGTRTRRFDVNEDVRRGQCILHLGKQPPRRIEVVDLEHGIDEIDEPVVADLLDRGGGAVGRQIFGRGVEAEFVVTEPDGLRPVDSWFADDDLDVHALAQRPGADRQLRHPEEVHRGLGDDRAGEDLVGPRGGDAREGAPLLGAHPPDAGDRLAHVVEKKMKLIQQVQITIMKINK